MKVINAVIIEDLPVAEEHLKKLLRDNCPQVNVIASFRSGKEAIKILPKLNYDLLFLDIEYNDNYNAFRLLEDLDFAETHIIFTTAFDTYRNEASEVDSIKYLLKPIQKDELVKAVERSMLILIGKDKLTQIQQHYEAVKTGKIMISSEGIVHFIDSMDIIYLEASGTYTDVFYVSENEIIKITSTQNLGKFESKLDARIFNRVHKKYLVNINYVKSCHRNMLKLAVGNQKVEVLISKDRRKDILETIALNSLNF